VGASPDETIHEKLFKRCKRAGILNHMKWFRGFPHQHMPALLDAVRSSGGVVMSTSKGDSFGMTIAEGMARGCPVVVPSGGPFDEFVVDGVHGCSYRLGSPRDGASKVGSLLEDGRFREAAGRRGRESILERHHPQIALQILATELKRMIEP
jgi:glycosyltransferase involved in cell wall biosynthesis